MTKLNTGGLRTSTLASLGVSIDGIELRCNSCGEAFMTPQPLTSGNFPRDWYECPRGCNKGAAKKPAA